MSVQSYNNRMSDTAKRGRPSNEELELRKDVPVQEVALPAPPLNGIICLHCGRGSTVRVLRTNATSRTVSCNSCSGKMVITYDRLGKPILGRSI